MKRKITLILGAILIISTAQIQSQENITEYDEQSKTYTIEEAIRDKQYVFSFDFNESSETIMWEGIFYMLKDRFKHHDFVLQCFSSGGETESYDKQLATERGDAVKEFLIHNGISEDKIEIEVYGNRDIYGIKSEGFGTLDYRYDRRVEPVFTPKKQTIIKDYVDDYLNAETLDDDIEEGEEIFLNIIEPYVTAIKEGNHLQELPGVGRPSDDQDEFEDQATSLIKETVKAGKEAFLGKPKKLAKLVATYTLGSFIDLFTSNQTKIISKNRKELYDMIIEAFTNECFPNYQSNVMTSDYYSNSQKYLFAILSYEISNLSNLEKYQIRTRFISGKIYNSYSTESKIRKFNTKMNRYSFFSANMGHYFSQSKYRYRD